MKCISLFAIALLSAFASFAQPNHVVISQVYGGGGNTGSVLKNDFIELYNPTTATVNLSGWSVQYASNTGTTWSNITILSGFIAPGQYFLIKEAAGGQGTTDLPTPDATGTINLAGAAGKVALVSNSSFLSGTGCPVSAAVVDFVGFGSSTNCFETATAPAPSATNSISRKLNGCQDNNNNSGDFTAGAAAPRNSASTLNFCATTSCSSPTAGPTALNLVPSITSISGSFTPSAAGAVNAAGYLVLVSTSSILSAQPVEGTIYNVDDDLGNAKVVAYGSSTSFTANNLTASTPYYFYVYAFSSTGCFNLAAQLKGNVTTNAAPPCTPPSSQATNFSSTATSSSGININFTRGNGDQVLVVYRANNAVDADPVNGTSYSGGSQIGSGNFVAYAGTSNSVSVSGLLQNTVYHFAIYEYNTTGNCYNLVELTGTGTTNCGYPSPVTAFAGSSGNAQVALSWTLPSPTAANGGCYDEIFILASTSSITSDASIYSAATANPVYSGGVQLVYRGTATNATISGLTNGTTYYFRAYSRLGSNYTPYSFAPQILVTPFDPSSGYTYLYGNFHGHSSYSDGNKENTTKTPKDDYEYARDAQCMDFLGISEHNHTGAGMTYSNYALGYSQANLVNLVPGSSGNAIVTLWGMEWGVSSSGGGHVLIYGFDDQLIGWEAGNYDIFCAKNDYSSLWTIINNRPNAFATLAHPGYSDFGNLNDNPYNTTADNALFGSAVESGPALDGAQDYMHYPTPLGFLTYYKLVLAKGYRMAPQIDQDNHYMTFGTINRNRTVVLATQKTRAAIIDAMRNMRFYASEDCNAKVDFHSGTSPMGSSIVKSGVPSLSVTVTDPDAGETVSTIEIWGKQSGTGDTATLIKSYTGASAISFGSSDAENVQGNNTTWYYFTIITQGDGNKMVSAPIWYSRSDISLPVTLIDFKAEYNKVNQQVRLSWSTAQEINSKEFVVERSTDEGRTWNAIASVAAAGSSHALRRYSANDLSPAKGTNLYRLKQVDLNNSFRYSAIEWIRIDAKNDFLIYPNPSNGTVYISSSSVTDKISVSIHDVNGKELKKTDYNFTSGTSVKMDVSALSDGIYFITVAGKGSSSIQKLVIKK